MRYGGVILGALAVATLQPSTSQATTPQIIDRPIAAQRFAAWADGVARDQTALEAATKAYDRNIRQAIRSTSYERALQAFEAYDDAVETVYRRLGPVPAIRMCDRAWMVPADEVARAESEELEAHERIIARIRRAAEDGPGGNVAAFAISGDRRSLNAARTTIASLLAKARSEFYAAFPLRVRRSPPACPAGTTTGRGGPG